jgi:hypothetical protein
VNTVTQASSQNSQKALEIGAKGRGVGNAAGSILPRPINTAPCGMATRYADPSHKGRDSRKSSVKALAQKHGIAGASIPIVETNQPSDVALERVASLMNHCAELNHGDYTGDHDA